MAQARAERERQYAINGAFGSLAYDLYSFGGTAAPQEIPDSTAEETARREERERAAQKKREAAQSRAKAIESAKKAQAVSIAGVLGYAVVALLMVFVILSYVKLTEVSTEITSINKEISALETEETRLKVEYERTFNLNAIKEYATSKLGMTMLTEANTHVITMQREDKAVVLSQDDSGIGFIKAARDFISSLAEYLR